MSGVQRKPPHSDELRALAIHLAVVDGLKPLAISRWLQEHGQGEIPRTTLSSMLATYRATGELAKRKHGGNHKAVVSAEGRAAVLAATELAPTQPAKDLQKELAEASSLHPSYLMSDRTIQVIRRNAGLTRKRVRRSAEAANSASTKQRRAEFAEWHLSPANLSTDLDTFLYLDETGFDPNQRPTYGYSPRSQRCILRVPTLGTRGRRSVIAVISPARGLVHYELLEKFTSGKDFTAFLTRLQPKLPAGSRLICDNASFHKTPQVLQLFSPPGSLASHSLHFLPPYSPMLNPIEEIFSKWKRLVRNTCPRNAPELVHSIHRAAKHITPMDCKQRFFHATEFYDRCLTFDDL